MGKVPRRARARRRRAAARPGALVEHPARAEGRLGQARQRAALADEGGLLVTGDPADGRGARERGRGADGPGRVDDRAASSAAGS